MPKTKPAPREAWVVEMQDKPHISKVLVVNETAQMYITDGTHQDVVDFCSLSFSSRITHKNQVFFSLAEAVNWLHRQAALNAQQLFDRAKKIQGIETELRALEAALKSDPEQADAILKNLNHLRSTTPPLKRGA